MRIYNLQDDSDDFDGLRNIESLEGMSWPSGFLWLRVWLAS
jgi:hypothetical protein